jgi:hypothetical protein
MRGAILPHPSMPSWRSAHLKQYVCVCVRERERQASLNLCLWYDEYNCSKYKVFPVLKHHTMKTYGGGIAPRILNLGPDRFTSGEGAPGTH